MNKLQKIFGKEKDIVIGAIHFPPLLGYPEFPGLDIALNNALIDLRAFEEGGVDGIIIENNYDIPHVEQVSQDVINCMIFLGEKIVSATRLPVGISVLWNDYRTALSIASSIGLKFIRVPVFVDTVETSYGIMKGDSKKVTDFRASIKATDVALFTDIHVKHAKLLSTMTITESAKKAIEEDSDGLILTGRWTGEAPELEKLKQVKDVVGDFPILCGSGIDATNIKDLFVYANGAIVSTSLKEGINIKNEVNVKPYSQRIDKNKVIDLINNL
jgi:hypothetical protein